jgi:hypothetical protein
VLESSNGRASRLGVPLPKLALHSMHACCAIKLSPAHQHTPHHTSPHHTTHTPQGENEKMKRNLQQLARTCDWLVLWLDCDREGENIAFEVIQVRKCWRGRGGGEGLAPRLLSRACVTPAGHLPDVCNAATGLLMHGRVQTLGRQQRGVHWRQHCESMAGCVVAGSRRALKYPSPPACLPALSLQVCTEANPRLTIRRARFSG